MSAKGKTRPSEVFHPIFEVHEGTRQIFTFDRLTYEIKADDYVGDAKKCQKTAQRPQRKG